MNKLSWPGCFCVVFGVALLLSFSFPTVATTRRVCTIGCDYSSISRAIDEAEVGDTIRVQNGTYEENLRIDKSIEIVGTSSNWVQISPQNENLSTIRVGPSAATEVTIRNVTVTGNVESESGISVFGDSKLTLSRSVVDHANTGISTGNSSQLRFEEGILRNTEQGIHSSGSSRVIFHKSKITNSEYGLLALDSSEVTILSSEITSCTSASLLNQDTAKINLRSSNISDNQGTGLLVADFSRLNVQDSQVTNNAGGGIFLKDSATVYLSNNEIAYNGNKNLSIVTRNCGFGGADKGFFGEVTGYGNKIVPATAETICPFRLSHVTGEQGGKYAYPFRTSTYAFVGLISAVTLYLILSR